jgi:hypothetical protein
MTEILKAFIGSYSAAVAVTAIVAMLLFRKPISRLLEGPIARLFDRIREIGRTGLKADAQQQEAKALEEINLSAAEVFEKTFPNELLSERQKNIRVALEGQMLSDASEREKYLVRLVAVTGTALVFEVIYRVIYGSQLAALHALNSAPMNAERLRPLYDTAAAREPALYQGYAFEQWLDFMVNNRLVLRIPNGYGLQITIEGREFLKFVVGQGLSLVKAG